MKILTISTAAGMTLSLAISGFAVWDASEAKKLSQLALGKHQEEQARVNEWLGSGLVHQEMIKTDLATMQAAMKDLVVKVSGCPDAGLLAEIEDQIRKLQNEVQGGLKYRGSLSDMRDDIKTMNLRVDKLEDAEFRRYLRK